jgi:6-phosphogluconate dehydrogenase
MPKFTLSQAAKETGKSKSLIHNAIKSGRLSAHKREDGIFEIDASELFRVFKKNVQERQEEPIIRTESERLERLLYEQKIDSLAQQLEREKQFNRELLLRLDSEAEERRKLILLLTHQQEQFLNRPENVQVEKERKKENLLWKKIFKE